VRFPSGCDNPLVPNLLVVWHSKTGGAQRLAEAVIQGAGDPAIEGVDVRAVRALDAAAADVRWADGIVLGTPANLGYMSGALKHFFDSIYYEVLDDTPGLPYALFVKGSTDADGAILAIEKIATGLQWKRVLPPLVVMTDVTEEHTDAAYELGATFAAALAEGLF
jgi:multimeric flavodoxin WrbA